MGEHYDLDRDDTGLTAREREVKELLMTGTFTLEALGAKMSPPVSRQRVQQIVKSLEAKRSTGVIRPRRGQVGWRPSTS